MDGSVAIISIKKFPYRPTRDVSLPSGYASYDTLGLTYLEGTLFELILLGLCLPRESLIRRNYFLKGKFVFVSSGQILRRTATSCHFI